jgi:hypothetical protein
MSELTFSQPERRSFLGPILIALAVLGIAGGAVYLYIPHRVADLTITHTAVLPTHTVFKTDSILVGAQQDSQDVFYVLTTIRVDNKLHVPLFISDFNATFTTADDEVTTTSAVEQSDLDNLYITFPALRRLAGAPLTRESSIQSGGHAEGMVLLHFPITQADWDKRKSATVTIDFYHQGSFTVTIPKDQGTGNSR